MIEKIHTDDAMTHMPFLTADAAGRTILFYCRSGREDWDEVTRSRRWKLWVAGEDDPPRRIATSLGADVCECSPTAWRDEQGWHVTFVAGGAKENPRFHLYRMDGPDLDRLGAPVAVYPTRTGFVRGDRLVYGEMENLVHVRRLSGYPIPQPSDDPVSQPSGDIDIELAGTFIYRVSYRADAPDTLLITGQQQTDDEVFTLEYDLATSRQHLIECDGRPAYKCTILGDQVLYAHRLGEHFETRRITAPTNGLSRHPTSVGLAHRPTTAVSIITFATAATGPAQPQPAATTVTTTSAALATIENAPSQPQSSGPDPRISTCLSCPDSRACPNVTTCCGGQVEVNITTPCPRGRW
jgi:hypothetical protein